MNYGAIDGKIAERFINKKRITEERSLNNKFEHKNTMHHSQI